MSIINKTTGIVSVVIFFMLLGTPQFSEANPPKRKFDKHGYQALIHRNGKRSCHILFKKRTNISKTKHVVSNKRYKTKPMAETDSPVKLAE